MRRIRSNAAGTGDNPNILKVTTHPAVPYEAGKVLISEGEAASGDMLPMWGFGSDRIWSNTLRFTPNYNRGVPYDNTVLDGYVFLAALRITPAGLVMEIGGRGSDGMDLRRVVGIAPPAGVGPSDVYYANDPPAADPHGWDLILTFGEPASSPEGNGEAYWAARLMPDPGQIAAGADADTRAKFLVGGRPYHIGTYKLWLSNHAGAETNLEPADGGSYPDQRFVDGHFDFDVGSGAFAEKLRNPRQFVGIQLLRRNDSGPRHALPGGDQLVHPRQHGRKREQPPLGGHQGKRVRQHGAQAHPGGDRGHRVRHLLP